MSNLITLFDQKDVTLFFDIKTKKLNFKKRDVLYNINLNSDNKDEESYKQRVENIESIIRALRISGKIGPSGPEGQRGRQGVQGKPGMKGDKGESFKVEYWLDSEVDLPSNASPNSTALIKKSLNLYVFINNKWENIGTLRLLQGKQGEKGEKGAKGDQGEQLKIDYIIDKEENLDINIAKKEGDIALTQDTFNLFIMKNCYWKLIGRLTSIPGKQGPRGQCGPRGQQGEPGTGLKFSYIVSDCGFLPKKAKRSSFALIQNK